uniref:Putative conserved secreted protein n=1 Tax=Panstrongylus lignarius TaxID=156445 RepID=A0A224XZY3_9HEMI
MYLRLQFIIVLLLVACYAAQGFRYRQKRVSDQRLAELETLVALSHLKGHLKPVTYGYGSVNPMKIGRKRRSATSSLLLDKLLDQMEEKHGNYLEEADEVDDDGDGPTIVQWPPYYWHFSKHHVSFIIHNSCCC